LAIYKTPIIIIIIIMRYYTTTILALGFFTFQTVTSFAIPAKRPLVGLEPPFEGLGPVKLPHNPPIRALEPVQERTYEDKPGSGIPLVQYIKNEETNSLTRVTKNHGPEKPTTEEPQTQEVMNTTQPEKGYLLMIYLFEDINSRSNPQA